MMYSGPSPSAWLDRVDSYSQAVKSQVKQVYKGSLNPQMDPL